MNPKAIPNPFASAKDPHKMSDLFVGKATKAFFDNFEEWREENFVPKFFIDMSWEQVHRIHTYIMEEQARKLKQEPKNPTALV